MRIRIVFVTALASLTLSAVGVSAAGAANGTTVPPKGTSIAPLYTQPITGVAKNKKFNGKFGIQRFVVGTLNGKRGVYAVGTLTGRLNGQHVTRYGVMIPASLTGTPAGKAKAAATCPVLNLVLAPINLNLLGLQVKLGGGTAGNLPILLNITAISGSTPGSGLLGNLLCGLSTALNQGGALNTLSGQLTSLAGLLNGLGGLLGGLGL